MGGLEDWFSIAFVRTHPDLVFLGHQGRNFRSYQRKGDWKLAAPINFIRGISARKLDSFRLDFVSVSDERGSVISDYLKFNIILEQFAY